MTKIDEQTLKEAVARGIPSSGGYLPPPYTHHDNIEEESDDDPANNEPSPLKNRCKGSNSIEDYRKRYFTRLDIPTRQLIYVSEEVHESLMDIVKVIGGKRATMGSYVENILRSHLSDHKELLNRVHKSKYKSPVKW